MVTGGEKKTKTKTKTAGNELQTASKHVKKMFNLPSNHGNKRYKRGTIY